MFQTFRLLCLSIFTLNIIFCDNAYVIYTTEEFEQSAELIATLHNQTIPLELGLAALNTQIKYKEDLNQQEFTTYLDDNFDNFNKKYLLIIGDESIISPIVPSCSDTYTLVDYTDDVFNNEFTVGRLLVKNNQEALDQIYKIEDYILNSDFKIWKNKILLIADDEHNPDNPNIELEHTEQTNILYNSHLKNKATINTLYGTDYKNKQHLLTDLIINTINSGVNLINYIGHGSSTHLSHEDIFLIDRDVDLIQTNNRPPIWVVGTCSFGDYKDSQTSFAEKILKKPDAGIAILATTAGIGYISSFSYLNEFYNQLSQQLETSEILRIGDIIKNAKDEHPENVSQAEQDLLNCIEHTYQLFGDPALPIMMSKQDNNIFEEPTKITIGEQNSLSVNYDGTSYIKIVTDDIEHSIDNESLQYQSPGGTLFEAYFDNQIDYYIPIDIAAESAQIIIYNSSINTRSNNYINTVQFSSPIALEQNINQQLLEDIDGPEIKLYNNNIELTNNTSISYPYNFKIEITDNLPINISGDHDHNLLFWINDERENSIILNNLFNPSSDTSGTVILNFEDSKFEETAYYLNVESFDILNNNTLKRIRINIDHNLDNIFNVYNFPNPFSDRTFFTFHMKNPEPIDIAVTVISKTGKKIITFKESIDDIKAYHVLPESGWDGTNKNKKKLNNGTYLYHLNIKTKTGNTLHDKIHKLTLLK